MNVYVRLVKRELLLAEKMNQKKKKILFWGIWNIKTLLIAPNNQLMVEMNSMMAVMLEELINIVFNPCPKNRGEFYYLIIKGILI